MRKVFTTLLVITILAALIILSASPANDTSHFNHLEHHSNLEPDNHHQPRKSPFSPNTKEESQARAASVSKINTSGNVESTGDPRERMWSTGTSSCSGPRCAYNPGCVLRPSPDANGDDCSPLTLEASETKKRGSTDYDWLQCRWSPKTLPPRPTLQFPSPAPSDSGSQVVETLLLNNFKYFSSVGTKFFDWDPGTCWKNNNTPARSRFSAQYMEVAHSFQHNGLNQVRTLKSRVYRLRNACFSAAGKLAGYDPEIIDKYKGRDDVYGQAREPYVYYNTENYFDQVHSLDSPPSCFYGGDEEQGGSSRSSSSSETRRRVTLLIMPVLARSQNLGHVYMRLASLLHQAVSVYGEEAVLEHPENFVVMFLFPSPGVTDHVHQRKDLLYLNQSHFRYFSTLLSMGHFVSYAPAKGGSRLKLEEIRGLWGEELFVSPSKYSEEYMVRLLSETRVCFKEALVYQTCFNEECDQSVSGSSTRAELVSPPSLVEQTFTTTGSAEQNTTTTHHLVKDWSPAYPLYGRRSKVIHDLMIRHLRTNCLGIAGSQHYTHRAQEGDTSSLRVLLDVRSLNRKWVAGPSVLAKIKAVVEQDLKGELILHEMATSNVRDVVALYSTIDIVLASYGAGLFFTIFMQPGSVAIEVNTPRYRVARGQGIDNLSNRRYDYGGLLPLSGIHYINAPLHEEFGKTFPTTFSGGTNTKEKAIKDNPFFLNVGKDLHGGPQHVHLVVDDQGAPLPILDDSHLDGENEAEGRDQQKGNSIRRRTKSFADIFHRIRKKNQPLQGFGIDDLRLLKNVEGRGTVGFTVGALAGGFNDKADIDLAPSVAGRLISAGACVVKSKVQMPPISDPMFRPFGKDQLEQIHSLAKNCSGKLFEEDRQESRELGVKSFSSWGILENQREYLEDKEGKFLREVLRSRVGTRLLGSGALPRLNSLLENLNSLLVSELKQRRKVPTDGVLVFAPCGWGVDTALELAFLAQYVHEKVALSFVELPEKLRNTSFCSLQKRKMHLELRSLAGAEEGHFLNSSLLEAQIREFEQDLWKVDDRDAHPRWCKWRTENDVGDGRNDLPLPGEDAPPLTEGFGLSCTEFSMVFAGLSWLQTEEIFPSHILEKDILHPMREAFSQNVV